MRIGIDGRALIGDNISGVTEYSRRLVNAMTRLESKHEFVGYVNTWTEPALSQLEIDFNRTRWPNKILTGTQKVFGRPSWDDVVPADIWLVPNLGIVPRHLKGKMVVTVHDLSFQLFPEFYSIKRRLWHKTIGVKALLQRADGIIAVSESTALDIQRLYGISENKIRVIYSGVTKPKSDWLKQSEVKNVYILFLGVLEPRKNVLSLIEAYESLNLEIDLVLAGARGWLENEVKRRIKQSPAREKIKLIGQVSEQEKWKLLAGARVFVYPSWYEGFGFPPLEALLAGTPVITSQAGSLPEIVGKWAYMVEAAQPRELANVLRNVVQNTEEIDRQTQAKIEQKYSWQACAQQTLQFMEEVCG